MTLEAEWDECTSVILHSVKLSVTIVIINLYLAVVNQTTLIVEMLLSSEGSPLITLTLVIQRHGIGYWRPRADCNFAAPKVARCLMPLITAIVAVIASIFVAPSDDCCPRRSAPLAMPLYSSVPSY